jgi:magnesium-transporting ATPase (P-type)
MRIEMKHEAELKKRKGLTWKTLLSVLWLLVAFSASYLIAVWLFSEEYLSTAYIYQNLLVPANISETVITLGTAFVIFLAIQFIVLILFAFASPKAKRRTGVPRADSDNPDPYEKSSYHQR